jgi:hypothetical protein
MCRCHVPNGQVLTLASSPSRRSTAGEDVPLTDPISALEKNQNSTLEKNCFKRDMGLINSIRYPADFWYLDADTRFMKVL